MSNAYTIDENRDEWEEKQAKILTAFILYVFSFELLLSIVWDITGQFFSFVHVLSMFIVSFTTFWRNSSPHEQKERSFGLSVRFRRFYSFYK
jgi:hypothetical protein